MLIILFICINIFYFDKKFMYSIEKDVYLLNIKNLTTSLITFYIYKFFLCILYEKINIYVLK